MNALKEARLSAGLTQKRMSEVFGIPKRTIENWEEGRSFPPAWVERLLLKELERVKEGI